MIMMWLSVSFHVWGRLGFSRRCQKLVNKGEGEIKLES
jgi:hypothetical protein